MVAVERLEEAVAEDEVLQAPAHLGERHVDAGRVQLVVELLEDHLRNHVVDVESDALRSSGAAELSEVMRRYLK